ncbi:hypothetical protein NHX12_007475 [Muraenolepis orangiensis]|uniref:Uncharacterized protein n=1 Tax=Muraenolepis orangiensis TaxID=630683 RepID=A0A9Q0IC02_9TELE|nr:hypothetical protein NHX12_007475 [Muraenolepis orangiensis]
MNKVVFLWLLTTCSGGVFSNGGDDGVPAVCPGPCKAFNGSCYEFVGVKRSLWGAQTWCEQCGGHLAFVCSEETQGFLLAQLDPDRDWWLGLAPPGPADLDMKERTGSLSWLDGSDVFYSHWVDGLQPVGCSAYLQGSTLFHWKATADCDQELNFVCQHESGRAIACEGRDLKLLCPAEECDGLQVCRSGAVKSSLGEPCPVLGSYLSVQYHCEHALKLSVNKRGSVSENVIVRVTWKWRIFPVSCRLTTGDGHVTHLPTRNRSESSMAHRYVHPGVYTVRVDCSTAGGGEMEDVSVQTDIVIGSPAMELHALTCYSGDLLTTEDDCTALLGRRLVVRLDVAPGTTPTTYTLLQSEGVMLASSVTASGNTRPSLTVSSATLELLGLGCYALSLHASDTDPSLVQTRDLQKEAHVRVVRSAGLRITATPGSTVTDPLGSITLSVEDGYSNPGDDNLKHLWTCGVQLLCSEKSDIKPVFLPAGRSGSQHKVTINATIEDSDCSASVTAQVKDTVCVPSVEDLRAIIYAAMADLQEQGQLTPETLSQVFLLVTNELNDQTDESQKEAGIKLREEMLSIMKETMARSPITTTQGIQMVARFLAAIDWHGLQLSLPLQMTYMSTNPFSWDKRGNISGIVCDLTLSWINGPVIHLRDMPVDIEIILPRTAELQQGREVMMDLSNHSTTVLHVHAVEETALIKILPMGEPLPLKVYLGSGFFPTTSNYTLMAEMPFEGTTQDEKYTWLVEPEEFGGKVGVYYLVLRPMVGPGIKYVNATVNISTFTTSCKFWNETELQWSNSGCRLGVGSTLWQTQCFCNHLTVFGSSFFVMPNTIDMSRTAELFGSFTDNPVVGCFLAALFLAYLLVVTDLEDNEPLEDYRYILNVSTGHRRGASTSSQVIITLKGSEGDSEAHHLSAGEKPVLQRGGVDLFLLTTPFSLGHLQSIRMWHDNSGSHPGWYVNKVVVTDMQTEQKWYFLCNCWLAEDVGDCALDMGFSAATEMDLKGFSNVFYSKTSSGFSDGHLWFSVVSRPPSSTFTRVQRVSCCFSLLLCTMLTSIMFYGVPQDSSEQVMEMGPIEFTWQQFMIGVQSTLLVFPVNVLIVSIFRYTRPRAKSTDLCGCLKGKAKARGPKSPPTRNLKTQAPRPPPAACEVTPESVAMDIIKTARSLSKTLKRSVPPLERELEAVNSGDISGTLFLVATIVRRHVEMGRPDGNGGTHADTQVRVDVGPPQTGTNNFVQMHRAKTQYLHRKLCYMEGRLSLLDSSHLPDQKNHRMALEQVRAMKDLIPDQMMKIHGSDLDKVTQSVVAGFFTLLYGLKFGKLKSISWLISMVVSFFESLLVVQPLKVLGLAVFFALVFKKVDEDDNYEKVQYYKPINSGARPICREGRLYRPPPAVNIEQMKRNRVKEQKAYALIKEILAYLGFMWMLLLVAYSQRDPNAFYLSQHIRRSFGRNTSNSMTYSQVFSWANRSLLQNLYGDYPGFITDGNSKLVGTARIRQVRMRRSACHTARPMDRFVADCHAPYSWEGEDQGSYDPGWRERTTGGHESDGQATPWTYQNKEQLRANAIWGNAAVYRAGGFAADLGPDLHNASSVLECLFSNTWLDAYTRALFMEFTVYNANVNLFCLVTLILETTSTGAFHFRSDLHNLRLYQTSGSLQFFIITNVFYFLFVFYYMFLQGKRMKEQRWAYFRCKWNLLELSIILLSWASLSVFIQRTVVGNRDIDYYHNHKQHFANFHETATADAGLGYLIAFLVLLATVKLSHLLRLNPKLHMIAATLQRAWSDISGFLVVITIMILAYAICGNLLFGWTLLSYRTLWDSVATLISLQLGIFNHKEVLDYSPLLGAVFIGSCTVFMTYMVLNLFITVILMAFSYERKHHKPSEEEEIVDLMLLKLYSLLGIRSAGPGPGQTRALGGTGVPVGSTQPPTLNSTRDKNK